MLTANADSIDTYTRTDILTCCHLALNHAPISTLIKIARTRTSPALTVQNPNSTDKLTFSSCASVKHRPNHTPNPNTSPSTPAKHCPATRWPDPSDVHRWTQTHSNNHRQLQPVFNCNTHPKMLTSPAPHMQNFLTKLATYHKQHPTHFHPYNIKEFNSQQMQIFLSNLGTTQTTTIPHTSQVNGTADLLNHTIINAARAALSP